MNGKLPGKPTAALVESFCRRTGYFLPRGAMEPEKLEKHPLIEVQTPGTEVEVLRWSSSRRLLRVTSQVPARLALRTYYFPGWTARVDGEDAPLCLGPEPPAGRILLDLPAGRHEALVTFENTAVRSLGVLVSALAIAGWAMALVLVSRKTVEGGREPSEAWRPEVPQEALRV